MNKVSCNCIICAKEFDPSELQDVVLSKLNLTNFKICQACFNISDPVDDYSQARKIVASYLSSKQAKSLFKEVRSIIESVKK